MQGHLGFNTKRALITIETADDNKSLYVYLGFLYYTTVPNDSTSIQYRLLVGQLALAGFSIANLMIVFGFSRPTIMRYRDAVKTSVDEAELFARLRGYHCEKTKLKVDVESYIRSRFATIYRTNRATYNSQLRDEVSKKFGITLSTEALRRVIAPLRHELDRNSNTVAGNSTKINEQPAAEINNISCCQFSELASASSNEFVEPADANKGRFHIHAGLLILNLWIADFIAGFKQWRAPFLQWLYQIFAGAVNLEQARYLARHELSRFIGEAASSVTKSRYFLSELAHNFFEACVQLIFKVNLNGIRHHWQNKSYYFYCDGHFDPYYGKTEILPGWSCLFNRAMKGTNHYVIHDAQGYPLIKELKDNFSDFRVYIKQAIQKIKSFMLDVPFGIVFDRGGFAEQLFCHFDAEAVYFVTWEKYFDINKESELKFDSTVTIEREINEVGHYKQFTFKCAETSYHLGETFSCRKLVICPEPTDNKSEPENFYASILTNDPSLSHQMIVELMTGRWGCQENDFRYEKKHFGLDQITSYDVTPVQSIQAQIDQQQGDLEALKTEQADTRQRQSQLYDRLGVKRLTKKRAKKIEQQADMDPQSYHNMITLRALQSKLRYLQAQITQQQKKIKRLEKIEKKGYVKLDYRKKQILDHIKFTARNIFYDAISDFKFHYNNLRDLHVVFWKLVRSPGFITYDKEQISVTLYCPFFNGRSLNAVQKFIEMLNNKKTMLLDNSNRNIVFYIKS